VSATDRPAVVALVPAREEAQRISVTVQTLLGIAGVDGVVVIDDASTDGTAAAAAAAGARVLRLKRRLGKGGALAYGLGRIQADLVLLIDADLGESAGVAAALLDPLLRGEADMSVACPPVTGPSGFGLVEGFARWGIERLTGRRMERPLSGQRAVRGEMLRAVALAPRFGIEVGLTVDVLRRGGRVVEVPFEISHARTGRDVRGFRHRGRQGWDIFCVLTRRAIRRGA